MSGASLVAQLVQNPPAMWETWVRFLGWEYSLEKGMATNSSILAWRIPWTIWSMGWQKVGHDTPLKSKKKMIQMNLFTRQKQTHRLREWIYGCQKEQTVAEFGINMPTLFKTDNHPGPTVQHRELFSMLHGSLDGRRVWGRTDTRVGFPGGVSGKGPPCQCGRHKGRRFDLYIWKIPRRAWQSTSVFFLGGSPWTEEPGGLSPVGSQRVKQDWSDLAHVFVDSEVKETLFKSPWS